MAVAREELAPPPMTYDDYLAEGEVLARYDIIDGVRIMTNPTRRHQRLLRRIARPLEDYAEETGRGECFIAPVDLLISRVPLRTRQPDVLFISRERLAQAPPETDPAPLEVAPELVVEILSPSESRRSRWEKLEDYRRIGVRECWLVSPQGETVELLRLTEGGIETAAVAGAEGTLRSECFPDLELPVARVFEP